MSDLSLSFRYRYSSTSLLCLIYSILTNESMISILDISDSIWKAKERKHESARARERECTTRKIQSEREIKKFLFMFIIGQPKNESKFRTTFCWYTHTLRYIWARFSVYRYIFMYFPHHQATTLVDYSIETTRFDQ